MRRTIQSIGALFGAISLALLLVSIITTQWLVIRVDRERQPPTTSSDLAYWDRYRGLYRECWLNENLNPMIVNNDFYASENCVRIDMTAKNPNNVEVLTDYKTWTTLQLSVLVLMGATALLVLIALVFYLYTLCQHINRYEWKYGCKLSAAMMVTSLIVNCVGMALFHIAEYYERERVTDNGAMTLAPYSMFFTSDMTTDLKYRLTREYGWSYALSWCAAACELLSAVLFMVVSCCYVKSSKSKSVVYKSPKQTTVVVTQPTLERERIVMAPQKVYMVQDNSYWQHGGANYNMYNTNMNGTYNNTPVYDSRWMIQ